MGMSYTLCYCTYNKKCKSRVAEDKKEMFDESHWGEVSENIDRYLKEEVCVSGAVDKPYTSKQLGRLLREYVSIVSEGRRAENENPTELTKLLQRVWMILSSMSAHAREISLHGTPPSEQQPIELDAQQSGDSARNGRDPFVRVAAKFCAALSRASFELSEANKTKDDFSIFHHSVLVFDSVQEMHRLACEAMGHLSSERMLQKDHPHRQMLERRWDEAGI
jgi:hypothetical protein